MMWDYSPYIREKREDWRPAHKAAAARLVALLRVGSPVGIPTFLGFFQGVFPLLLRMQSLLVVFHLYEPVEFEMTVRFGWNRRVVWRVPFAQVNKGVYIKLGQHLAQLEYLLPDAFVDSMQGMLKEAPMDSYHLVQQVFEEDLGAPIAQLFASFEQTPIASASLAQVWVCVCHSLAVRNSAMYLRSLMLLLSLWAQVHIARSWTGEKLAVKVQHQGLSESATVRFRVHVMRCYFTRMR